MRSTLVGQSYQYVYLFARLEVGTDAHDWGVELVGNDWFRERLEHQEERVRR